ncbi:MAG: altronate dehydratase family protein [Oscillospiraceae bacterium]
MQAIKINSIDNVAVALCDLKKGDTVTLDSLNCKINSDIPSGHKFSVTSIPKGSDIIKYGCVIGKATALIHEGTWVHTHNVVTRLNEETKYNFQPLSGDTCFSGSSARTFKGYLRADGSVGVRNEVWIVPTVGCVNSIATALSSGIQDYAKGRVDNVRIFNHPYGCSQMGEDQLNTQKALAALVRHPNAGAVLVLGLGCENNNIREFQKVLGKTDPDRVKFLECQSVEDEIAEGIEILTGLVDYASKFTREHISVSKLIVGLKCGGSDGLSGISANPLVGKFSNKLIKCGGTTILTEVPEMFGAEELLFNRCESKDVFNRAVKLVDDFKQYFTSHNLAVYENPSPGNKLGGITTLEDKSCGCVQKGGTGTIVDVLDYTEPVCKPGVNLLKAPGNDMVSSTALMLSGAQIVLFTTGRGTPLGTGVPTLKISSNTALSTHKTNWIDFNAGMLINGIPLKSLADDLFDLVIETANGRTTRSETASYSEFAIFKQGITL